MGANIDETDSRILLREFRADLYIRLGEGIAQQVERLFFEYFSGRRIRIPSHRDYIREHEERRIRQEFNGRNYDLLAEKYGRSVSTIRRIIDRR